MLKRISFFLSLALTACAPSDNEVMIAQAKASIEQARAVESVARIGQIQATNGVLVSLILLLIVLEAAAIIYLVMKLRRSAPKTDARRPSSGRWVPGPNAGYRRLGPPPIDPAMIAQQIAFNEYIARLYGVPAEYLQAGPGSQPDFDFMEDEK